MKIKDFIKKHHFFLICAGITAMHLIYSIRVSGRQSLAFDEICEIGFIAKGNSWGQILKYFLTIEITNLPLFPLIAALWYRLVPWGQESLLLLTELMTAAGIMVLAYTGRRLKSERMGYLTAAVSVISSTLILRCDMEFRCYAFLFLTLAVALYFYVVRIQTSRCDSRPMEIKYAIALLFLAYSHYFGCLVIVALFIGDFFLFLSKRISIKFIFPYIFAGALLLPWFVAMLAFKEKSLLDFWPTPPILGDIPEALRFVLSNDEPIYVLFLIAMIAFLINGIVRIRKKDFQVVRDYFPLVLIGTIWFIIGIAFIYSTKINPSGGIWVSKYFISLFPAEVLLVSLILNFFIEKSAGLFTMKEGQVCGIVVAFLLLYFGVGNYYYDVKESLEKPLDPFREVWQYLNNQEDIDQAGTGVLVALTDAPMLGFREYYAEHDRAPGSVRFISFKAEDVQEQMEDCDTLYVFNVRNWIDRDETVNLNFDNFKMVEKDSDLYLSKYVKK
ncbi:MAG: glycosyltransferase family 39 protein [Lachnospiraceae bacterium]|nr:glycosyltransferase family 39 protein [Lachnospiraceae bacterium]